jgi:hypothetical protein
MSNMDPTKTIWKWIKELVKDAQFMFLIRHSSTHLVKSNNNIVGLLLEINNGGRLKTKLYDKCDDSFFQ